MTTLIILFVVAITISGFAAWWFARERGYDKDLFMIGGVLGGPFAVLAALEAHKYGIEEDEEDHLSGVNQPAPSQPGSPAQSIPLAAGTSVLKLAEPPLPGTPISLAPSLQAPPSVQTPSLPPLAAPPLPSQEKIQPLEAPLLPQQGGAGPPVPPLPAANLEQPKIIAPLAGNAPPIPKPIAPALPGSTQAPPLPDVIPTPVHDEPQDDEHKDQNVPGVASEQEAPEDIIPKPRSLVELVSSEPTTTVRRGIEPEEWESTPRKKGKTSSRKIVLGNPDEHGVPTIAVAPGEITGETCPHCGEYSWADWYGLCVECMQPFPVRTAWVDPQSVEDAVKRLSGDEETEETPSKISVPGLKK